ncbi:hypothetical protein Y032_0108g11 [Ancylostoma ceylanicum]|uniref:Uncharacterized protein n=1 Tax=Ancylostoma ceylanicum TaxID=53326 RepID=A0A016TEY0_9BILA|nr:hypothetical protein Y032_0108g11 [Ancylostoma ceylanicum]
MTDDGARQSLNGTHVRRSARLADLQPDTIGKDATIRNKATAEFEERISQVTKSTAVLFRSSDLYYSRWL